MRVLWGMDTPIFFFKFVCVGVGGPGVGAVAGAQTLCDCLFAFAEIESITTKGFILKGRI